MMNEKKIKQRTLIVMGALLLVLIIWVPFGSSSKTAMGHFAHNSAERNYDAEPSKKENTANDDTAENKKPEHSDLRLLLADYNYLKRNNPYEKHHGSMPPGGIKMKINSLGGTLGRVFNDSNYLHIEAAKNIGIEPLDGPKAAWEAGAKLERLQSCREYYLDNLTHSLPYLVPKAHKLLQDIGDAFIDSLQARGGGDYRIKVTSVLRTPRHVKRLRRRNRNATDSSAHMYGTTFDISYAKFICNSTGIPRTQEDMKNLLGEVVYAMYRQGRCYVKYERKQACFHITAK